MSCKCLKNVFKKSKVIREATWKNLNIIKENKCILNGSWMNDFLMNILTKPGPATSSLSITSLLGTFSTILVATSRGASLIPQAWNKI